MEKNPLDTIDVSRARGELLELLRQKAFERRAVVLSSGKSSDFYIDCKNVTLDARGHVLVGQLLLIELLRFEEAKALLFGGVGGLTLGADPIASAIALTSALAQHPIPAFIVRKEPKKHGTENYLEGLRNISPGAAVAVVEDVVTSGESALKAVHRARAAGLSVPLVLGLVDRLEGGRARIEADGLELVTLFDRRDFIPETP